MRDHISYIKVRLEAVTEDSLTVGLIHIDSEGKVKVFVSIKRLNLVESLMKDNAFDLFASYVERIKMAGEEGKLTYEYVERESRYQNGIVQITKPSGIASPKKGKPSYAEGIFNKRIDKYYND